MPYAADIPHKINSSTKAVIGTLTAVALKDGLLDSTDHRLLDFFGDRSLAKVDDRKNAITLQNILDMTSGINWTEPLTARPDSAIAMERSPDWIKFILDRSIVTAPGEVFNYNSGNPHLMSAILTKLTGMSASDYAKAKLFGPLGITTWDWPHDPQGVSIGGYGLAMLPRDMAKIGYLYLRNGEWEGKPLLPPSWIYQVSHATVNMNQEFEPELRYSNFFWALPNKQVYMANGFHCQLIMVFPGLDLVAVTTARDFCPLGKLADLVSGAVKSDTALPPDAAGASLLAGAIQQASTEKPGKVGATPEIAAAISGKKYNFPANGLGLKSLTMSLVDPDPHYEMEFYQRDPAQPAIHRSGPVGLDGRYRKSESAAVIIASRGTWVNGSTFALDRLVVGSGFDTNIWTLSFDGNKLHARAKDRGGEEVSVDGEAEG